MKKYIGAACSIGTICLLFYTLFDLKEQVKEINVLQKQLDSTTAVRDSLINEVFIREVENGRYETTLYHLEEVNPKAASEFKKYMDNETE
jgi:hypothetical protein